METVRISEESELAGWDEFVDDSPQGNLFCKSWWLRSTFRDDYIIVVVKNDGDIVAGMPLPFIEMGSKVRFVSPPMTTTMGVLFRREENTDSRYERKLSNEMKIMMELVSGIPKNCGFAASVHPSIQNWLPFYWAGYKQTTAYTYVLDDISDVDSVFRGMDHSKRKNIKKARKIISVVSGNDPDFFYDHHKSTLKKQGKVISYSREYLRNFYEAAKKHAKMEILSAVDGSGCCHSAIVIVWDRVSAYYVGSSIDPDYRSSGSVSLLLFEAMKLVSGTTKRFDFEGSMIMGVERSFRKFGARQVPYMKIYSEAGNLRHKTILAFERIARKFGLKE